MDVNLALSLMSRCLRSKPSVGKPQFAWERARRALARRDFGNG